VRYETLVTRGDPAEQVLNAARSLEADLIVMGTHGRKGLSHLVLGSVAERVVRESPVPVLTAHATTGARKG
jgi:nucleotide-binding universal stress UspA family protein